MYLIYLVEFTLLNDILIYNTSLKTIFKIVLFAKRSLWSHFYKLFTAMVLSNIIIYLKSKTNSLNNKTPNSIEKKPMLVFILRTLYLVFISWFMSLQSVNRTSVVALKICLSDCIIMSTVYCQLSPHVRGVAGSNLRTKSSKLYPAKALDSVTIDH